MRGCYVSAVNISRSFIMMSSVTPSNGPHLVTSVTILLPWILSVAQSDSLLPHGDGDSIAVGSISTVQECTKPSNFCEPLKTNTCFGTVLPYASTSLELANDSDTQTEVQLQLKRWLGLEAVPRCWDVVQPFLCAVYLPPCDINLSTLTLPTRELCEKTRDPCRVVEATEGWPEFLKCEQYPSGCDNPYTSNLRFNTSGGGCRLPLVATNNPDSWYGDVEGCGLQCRNPLFTEDEHWEIHVFIAVCATICMICTTFTILTFLIDWKTASRYPALILFFINVCFLVGSTGWLAQFFPGAREDIVCRRDGTLRQAEPQIGSSESASCSVVFIIVYYSMMAVLTWFVLLAYAWHLTFKVLGTTHDAMESKKGHFHVAAWSIPLVLTIACLAVSQIDGDSMSGICFVGYMDHAYRGGFVLVPVAVSIVIGLSFLLQGLFTLCRIRFESPGMISQRATNKIQETMIRLGIFTSLALAWAVTTFIVHVYVFLKEPEWVGSFHDYVICKAQVTGVLSNQTAPCTIASRPSLVAMEMNIFAYFGAGITMSSWVWNGSTRDSWKRFIRRVLHRPSNQVIPLQRRKVVMHKHRHQRRRLSVSFCSAARDDPLGMKMELESVTSGEMSSHWAVAVPPRLLTRHRAGGGPFVSRTRRYSDSDVQSLASFYQTQNHRVSVESRVETSEVEEVVTKVKKRKKRRRDRDNRVTPVTPITTITTTAVNNNKSYTGNNTEVSVVSSNVSTPHGSRNSSPASGRWGYRRSSVVSNESKTSSVCSITQVSQELPPSEDLNSISSNLAFVRRYGGPMMTPHGMPFPGGSGMHGLTDVEDPSSCFSTEVEPPPPYRCRRLRPQSKGNLVIPSATPQEVPSPPTLHNAYRSDPVIPIDSDSGSFT